MNTPSSVETQTEDGWILHGELRLPEGEPRAVAVLGHAMWVDRRTLDRPRGAGLASTLVERGIACLLFDMRGHGESGPLPRDGGRFAYDHYVLYDVPAIVEAARKRFPNLPVVLVGHSLTGHTGAIAAGLFPDSAPDAIVAIAANCWIRRFEPSVRLRLVKGLALLAWAAVTYPEGHFDARRYGLGSSGVPWGYVRQYVEHYFRDHLHSADGRYDYLAALSHIQIPIYSLCSQGDRFMAEPRSVRAFFSPVSASRLRHREVRRGEVDPLPGHMELVTSIVSKPLWEDIGRFILTVSARGGVESNYTSPTSESRD